MVREKIIVDLIRGKRVLDVGSLGQSDEYCLWNIVAKYAGYAKGVDLPEGVSVLTETFDTRKEGCHHGLDRRIVYGNMETIDLGERFDVVVAGDVIEHVSNQGLFLDNIKKHLQPNAKLVLTTPNAKWPTVMFRPNITHALWHDIYTLKAILSRHGFSIECWRYYVGNKPHYNLLKKILAWRQQILVIANCALDSR